MAQKRFSPLFFFILTFGLLPLAGLFAQQPNKQYSDYVERYKVTAIYNQQQYRIPASITMAQAILESGAGRGRLATQANNHFGIKCGGTWKGRTIAHDDDARGECFRVYENADESFKDHAIFLSTRSRYALLFELSPKDYRGWAHGLSRAGYATARDYPQRLIKIIEDYELHRLDLEAEGYAARSNKTSPGKEVLRKEEVAAVKKHERIKINGLTCVLTSAGDTYSAIAEEFGISERRIVYYNDLPEINSPIVGNIVYLKKKKSKAQKGVSEHRVRPGENLHYISQMYGMTLKALFKYNDFPVDYHIESGDQIKLR